MEPQDVASRVQIECDSVGDELCGLMWDHVCADGEGGEVGFIVGRGVDQGLDIDVEELGVGMLGACEEIVEIGRPKISINIHSI